MLKADITLSIEIIRVTPKNLGIRKLIAVLCILKIEKQLYVQPKGTD